MDIKELERYYESALHSLNSRDSLEDIEEWYRQNFAKNGLINQAKKNIGKIHELERQSIGKRINEISSKLEREFLLRQDTIRNKEILTNILKEKVDVTLPSRKKNIGTYHPVSQMLREVYAVFSGMGFTVFDTPHVELDLYNFQLLSLPPDHAARDMRPTPSK